MTISSSGGWDSREMFLRTQVTPLSHFADGVFAFLQLRDVDFGFAAVRPPEPHLPGAHRGDYSLWGAVIFDLQQDGVAFAEFLSLVEESAPLAPCTVLLSVVWFLLQGQKCCFSL